MREIKFDYIWKRPDRYYGPYSPSDTKFKHTVCSLKVIENAEELVK